MIEVRKNGLAIIHEGLGYNGDDCKELEITNWNTSYVPEIRIKTKTGVESMEFKVDEFIALAEIFKQLKGHRR